MGSIVIIGLVGTRTRLKYNSLIMRIRKFRNPDDWKNFRTATPKLLTISPNNANRKRVESTNLGFRSSKSSKNAFNPQKIQYKTSPTNTFSPTSSIKSTSQSPHLLKYQDFKAHHSSNPNCNKAIHRSSFLSKPQKSSKKVKIFLPETRSKAIELLTSDNFLKKTLFSKPALTFSDKLYRLNQVSIFPAESYIFPI